MTENKRDSLSLVPSDSALPRPDETRLQQFERLNLDLREILNELWFYAPHPDYPTPWHRFSVTVEFRDLEAIWDALSIAEYWQPMEDKGVGPKRRGRRRKDDWRSLWSRYVTLLHDRCPIFVGKQPR